MVFLWFLILSVPTSLLCRKYGRRKMVIAGNVITLAGMIIPLLLFTFPACLTAFALLGIGNTILQVSLNPLLTDVVDGKALSSSLTAGQVIKAVSSFSGPFIVTFAVTAWGDWKMMFPVFAVLSVLSAAWLAMTPIKEKAQQQVHSDAVPRNRLRCRCRCRNQYSCTEDPYGEMQSPYD